MDQLAPILERLTPGATILEQRQLGGGIPGARTFLLRLDGGDAVLKVTPPDCEDWRLERSRREAAFYGTLAPGLPLRVPEPLGSLDAPDVGVCLLVAAYAPLPAGDLERRETAVAIGEERARLHAQHRGRSDELAEHAWLRRHDTTPTESGIVHARASWSALHADPRFERVLDERTTAWAAGLIDETPALAALGSEWPAGLCHGDCHPGNVLRSSGGELVWADWQDVGIGSGVADVAFFLQRGEVGGVRLQREPLVDAYRGGLERATGEPVAAGTLRRILAAHDLRSFLLDWPQYLAGAAEGQVSGIVARMREAARALGLPVVAP